MEVTAVAADSVVVLYGSQARGESDSMSDTDLLFICESGQESTESVQLRLAGYSDMKASQYFWAEIESMGMAGSLFLHHLRQEGVLLRGEACGESRYVRTLDELGAYVNVRSDVRSFVVSLDDVEQSLLESDPSLYFEAAAIATVVRHGSILGCYLVGLPEFGRYTAVAKFAEATGLASFVSSDFVQLYDYRLAQDGRVDWPPEPTREVLIGWLGLARQVVAKVQEFANAR